SAALRGTGDARTPFRFLLLSVLLDILFNPLVLFGIGPFPALGIAGAAWATLIAQVVALAGLLIYLRKKRHVLWLGRSDLRLFLIDTTILRALIVKGVLMGLQMVMISLSMIAMLSLVNSFGTETAAAFGAGLQLWNYVQMPAMAVGAACLTMAAQNVGAGLWPRVDAVARTGIAANFLMTGLLIVLLILFDRWTLALFLPEGSATLEVARHLNHIAIWSFLLFGVSFVVSGVVRATGAVTPPLLILAFSLWGVRVPLANVLRPHLGADAVWWSFPISSSCSMLLSLAYYRWGGWRKARMLATPMHPSELAAAAEVPARPASLVADPAPLTDALDGQLPQAPQR
ncbi:MATE family efflux transporter, partial [Xanthomonas oryzae]